MKIIKIIIVCLALLAGEKLSAQNGIVNNNTPLDNGFASFGFSPGSVCDFTTTFSASTTGNTNGSCSLTLDHVRITFDDPSCPTNPQAPVILTPGAPAFTYTPCSGPLILFQLTFVSPDWVVDIN